MTDKPTLIITGASRGLGAATARIAAGIGANVVLMARSAADLEDVAREIRAAGGTALPVHGDVTHAEDCRRVVAVAVERFGRVDGLINNAGVIEPLARVADADPDVWEALLHVNLIGALRMTCEALPFLRRSQGRIVNVSSGVSLTPRAGFGAYAASKGALNVFTKSLVLEEPRITSVAFRPGPVDTIMQDVIRAAGPARTSDETHAEFMGHKAQGTLLPPEVPGRAMAVLALYATRDIEGELVSWKDERVAALVARYAPADRA